MKKNLLAGLAVGVMMLGMAGMALADSHYDGHEYDKNDDHKVGTYHHDDDSGHDEGGNCTEGSPCPSGSSVHTWYDEIAFISGDKNYMQFDSLGDTATVKFDISPPFTPGTDTITEVKFLLDVLLPCKDGDAASAKVIAGTWSKSIGDLTSGSGWDWSSTTNDADILGFLNSSGELTFTIKWKDGDFKVTTAGIEATGCDYPDVAPPAHVPEPATMLLMGSGLTGLVAARRKKKA